MNTVLATFLAILGVSLISALAAVFYPRHTAHLKVPLLLFVGVAIGALLGDAFIHLIPEAQEHLADTTGLWVLGGIGIFFLMEKVLHWHHHHKTHAVETHACDDCEEHVQPFGVLVIVADVVHNILDGIIIAAAFLVSTEAGIATTIAVALHELPQEIGDFGVLLHAGFSRAKALLANVASALSAFVGAGIVLLLGEMNVGMVPLFSALAAGSFIYIAMADLVPELHKHTKLHETLVQLGAVVTGVLLMFSLTALEGDAHTEPVHTASPASEAVVTDAPLGTATIQRVIDGDTLIVSLSGRDAVSVRLIGIDAPETYAGSMKEPECYAEAATSFLRNRLPEYTVVSLIPDPTQDLYDRYGRLLAYVTEGSELINERLIIEGAAREYTYQGNAYEHRDRFIQAESMAQEDQKGLWGACR